MNRARWKSTTIYFLAVVFGLTASAVDNFVAGGEVSPIVVVLILTCSVGMLAATYPQKAWVTALLVGIWVPLVHFVKHVLGLPDTLHPNTYGSILMLATFSLVVCFFAAYASVFLRWVISRATTRSVISKRWFRPWRWVYLPVSWQGIVVCVLVLIFCVQVFLAVDGHSHSASDTFYGVFPYFACCLFLLNWLASKTSRSPSREDT